MKWSKNANYDYITNQTMSAFLFQATITYSQNDCHGLPTGVPACTLSYSLFTTQQPEEFSKRKSSLVHSLTQSPKLASHHTLNKVQSPH